VHFVFDSKSWRKEYITSFFEKSNFKTSSAPTEFKYKGNRKYDDHQYLFFDYFQQVLIPVLSEKCGINYYRLKGTEGDDLIAYLCETLGKDILIYSVDQDLKQLVGSFNRNILLIVPKQMSKAKKIFIPQNLVPDLAEDEEDSFFSLSASHISGSTVDKVITSFKNKEYLEHRIEPTDELILKILLGDKSDNIPKVTGLTPVKAKKVIAAIQEKFGNSFLTLLDTLDSSLIEEIVNEISIVNKIKDQDKIDEIREHLLFNIKIIRLSTNVFPDEIKEALEQFFANSINLKFNSKEFIYLKNNQTTL